MVSISDKPSTSKLDGPKIPTLPLAPITSFTGAVEVLTI